MSHVVMATLTYPLRSFGGLHGFVCDWRVWKEESLLAHETPMPFGALATGFPLAHHTGYAPPLGPYLAQCREGYCLATGLQARRDREVLLWFGAFEGYSAWLNGMPLVNRWRERQMRIEQAVVPVRLPQGRSVLRLAIARKVTPAFCVRITDIDEGPLGDVVVSLPTPTQPFPEPLEPGQCPFTWFATRYQETPDLAFDTTSLGSWRDWRQALLRRLSELIREPVLPTSPPVEVRSREQCDGYERVDLRFAGALGLVPAYLLLPEKPLGGAALLCLHGHGRGRADVVGLAPAGSSATQTVRAMNYDYAAQAAQRGYVVLAPEFAGFGERADPEGTFGHRDRCDASFLRGLMVGEILVGAHLAEARAALGVLAAQPQVDEQRLGVVGLSFGGRMAMFLSATDERVQACVASGALNTFKERLMTGSSCGAQFIPGLLQSADTPEIFGAIAPRPLLLELGVSDGCCPEIFAIEAYRRIQRIYRASGAEENLEIEIFRSGHKFYGKRAWTFLEEKLAVR